MSRQSKRFGQNRVRVNKELHKKLDQSQKADPVLVRYLHIEIYLYNVSINKNLNISIQRQENSFKMRRKDFSFHKTTEQNFETEIGISKTNKNALWPTR